MHIYLSDSCLLSISLSLSPTHTHNLNTLWLVAFPVRHIFSTQTEFFTYPELTDKRLESQEICEHCNMRSQHTGECFTLKCAIDCHAKAAIQYSQKWDVMAVDSEHTVILHTIAQEIVLTFKITNPN